MEPMFPRKNVQNCRKTLLLIKIIFIDGLETTFLSTLIKIVIDADKSVLSMLAGLKKAILSVMNLQFCDIFVAPWTG